MIIYSSDVAGFKHDSFTGRLIETIDRQVRDSWQQSSGREVLSWENSLKYMEGVIHNSRIPDDCGIAIEYMIPTTSKRIDFLISGYDKEDKSNLVIIELKQWSEAHPVEEPSLVEANQDSVITYLGKGNRIVTHPCCQALDYARLLRDFNESAQEGRIGLHPCAFLHNYSSNKKDDALTASKFNDLLEKSPLFDRYGAPELAEFIRRYVVKGDQRKVLFEIEHGKIRPSKSLQDRLASMLQGNQEFILVDDQRVVYERAISMAERTMRDDKKRVFLVEGGPGTGKSVVAVNLLVELINRDKVCHYITKNVAPRDVYKSKLKGSFKVSTIDNLFKSSGIYYKAEANEIDVAIVDEAHRLNKKSGVFSHLGENQILEIMLASKCSVFFIDDNQRVTTKDYGSKEEILRLADSIGAEVIQEELQSQFRCNGSDGYLAWVDNTLQIRETANPIFDFDYDFDVVSDPNELLRWVKSKNQNNKARVLAGYCWDWPKKERANSDFHDIQIPEHNFGISWNLDQDIWALSKESINEAGCIHTSQGLEFEYVGLIIGPDLYYENGLVKTDVNARAKTDASINGLKKMQKEDPLKAKKLGEEIIKNTYRTLLTRGLKGCRVYCTDEALADYIKARMKAEGVIYQEPEELTIKAAESKE